jgi:hypothetical protein
MYLPFRDTSPLKKNTEASKRAMLLEKTTSSLARCAPSSTNASAKAVIKPITHVCNTSSDAYVFTHDPLLKPMSYSASPEDIDSTSS